MTGSRPFDGPIVVIGAGPTGLGAGYRLAELGHDDFLLLEAESRVGGLATSDLDPQGFTWDVGGHVQFSHYDYYDRVLDRALGTAWLEHEREAWVRIAGGWVPYPFQSNLHRLPPELCARALAGLETAHARPRDQPPADFRTWILETFGEGIAEIFLFPYNLKVWGHPLEQMGTSWMRERVAVPDLERIRRNVAERRDDVSWGPNNRFRFPERGGTGAIWEGVARLLPPERLRLKTRVASIDLRRRRITTESGESIPWRALVSTMPLDRLCERTVDLPSPLVEASRRLRHSAVHVLGFGLDGPRPDSLAKKCWIYFPEPTSPHYRVTVFSNYSPRNVPPDDATSRHWSLMAEVCESPSKPVDAATLLDDSLRGLRHDGLLPAETRVVSRWHRREEHGYPIPALGRDEILDVLLPALAERGVYSRGRFGAWTYEISNQDHCFMQGVEVVDRLLNGGDEPTLSSRS